MVARGLVYEGSKMVDASSFESDGYFSARLSIARVQQYPVNGEDVLELAFVDNEQKDVLPPKLRHSLTGKNIESFMSGMGVFVPKQLKGRNVVAVIERSIGKVVAISPSSDIL